MKGRERGEEGKRKDREVNNRRDKGGEEDKNRGEKTERLMEKCTVWGAYGNIWER